MLAIHRNQAFMPLVNHRLRFPPDLLRRQHMPLFLAIITPETAIYTTVDTHIGTIERGKKYDSVVINPFFHFQGNSFHLFQQLRVFNIQQHRRFAGCQQFYFQRFLQNIPHHPGIRTAGLFQLPHNLPFIDKILPVYQVFVDFILSDNLCNPFFRIHLKSLS